MEFVTNIIENQFLLAIFKIITRILLILIMATVVSGFGRRLITKFFETNRKSVNPVSKGRKETLTKLSQSILYYVIYFTAVITILDIFVSITPLLTGAGVLGLAVGFGAQEFVKDVVSGFFILFEGRYDVGDTVQINGISGIVEELGIRTTKIKDDNGAKHYLSNGAISQVTNLSQN